MRKRGSISNPTVKKILLLLGTGLALGFSRTPKGHMRLLKTTSEEWQKINEAELRRRIKSLYTSKLVSQKRNGDGSITYVLTEEGRQKVLTFNIEKLVIPKMSTWDKKWRIVLFDIPEWRKKLRDAFRFHLKKLGFLELQKSVFVHPYNCREELEFLIEFYEARPFVRTILADTIDTERHLLKRFKL